MYRITHQLAVSHNALEDIGNQNRTGFDSEFFIGFTIPAVLKRDFQASDDDFCPAILDRFDNLFQIRKGSISGYAIFQIIAPQGYQDYTRIF